VVVNVGVGKMKLWRIAGAVAEPPPQAHAGDEEHAGLHNRMFG
jgi:hypothetical protein